MSKSQDILAAIHATESVETIYKKAVRDIEKVINKTKSPKARAVLDEAYYKLASLILDVEVERQFLLGEYVEYCKQK
jgi:hypothetical protein